MPADPLALVLARQLLETSGRDQVEPGTLDALRAVATTRTYSQGQVLHLRGDPMPELLVILSGSIEASIEDAEGRRSVMWYLGPGQWLGLIAIVDGYGSVHNLRAHVETTALGFPRQRFLDAVASDAGLALLCLNALCERSRTLYANLAAEGLLGLRARIARLLLMLFEQHGQAGPDGPEIGLKFTQDDFAAMLGISRQSLNRELRGMESAGIIALAYSRIGLRDVAALRAAATDALD
jgi:CRP-like cAMP-binding protein